MSDVDARLRDPERLAALARTGLVDEPAEAAFQRLAQAAARLLAAPVALVSLVDEHRQFFAAAVGLPEPWASLRETPLTHSFCKHIVCDREPLVVSDARLHPALRESLAIPDLSIVAYVGVPLETPDGYVIGSFCAADHVPRAWSKREVEAMQVLARSVMTEISLKGLGARLEAQVAERTGRLAEVAERLRLALSIAAVGTFEVRLDPDVFVPCTSTADLLRVAPDQELPLAWVRDRVHPTDRTALLRAVQTAVPADGPDELELELRVLHAPDDWRWVKARARLRRDEGGRLVSALGVLVDVSDARRASEALHESRRFLRSIADTAPVGIYAYDPESGTTHFVNERLGELLGYPVPRDGQLGPELLERLVHPDDAPRLVDHLRHLAAAAAGTVGELEFRIRHRGGGWRWILGRHTRFDGGGPGRPSLVIGAAVDITDHKHAHAKAEEDAALQRTRGDLAGLLAGSGPGQPLQAMLQQVAELLVARVGAAFARVWLLDEARQVLVLRASAGLYTHLDGAHAEVPVGMHKIGLIAEERLPHVTNAVVGDPRVHDQAWAKATGMVAFAGYPLVAGERLVGVLALFSRAPVSPATARTLAEGTALVAQAVARKLAEEELEHARAELERRVDERTASLESSVRSMEELLYTIAHDLRAPNRAIRGYAELLGTEHACTLPPDALGFLRRIAAAAARNDALIIDLLELGRISHTDVPLQPVDLGKAFQDAIATVEDQVRATGARLVTCIATRHVVANHALLERVLVNLLANALKYARPATAPDIEVSAAHLGDRVLIRVQDRGIGIPAEQQAQVFDPFIRLPGGASRPGTGIGLALVRKAVERMHGRVGVESAPGAGSCFWVELPAPDAP